jgi:hypothetical protein
MLLLGGLEHNGRDRRNRISRMQKGSIIELLDGSNLLKLTHFRDLNHTTFSGIFCRDGSSCKIKI